MIKEFTKSIGYICPFCSTITVKDINLFDLSGDKSKSFNCKQPHCKRTAVSILSKKDKYSITVDCPICGDPHHFDITKISFWKRELFIFHCPETGIGILFLGANDKIREEIDAQEKILAQMEEDMSIDDELSGIFETVEHINEIAKNDGIFCKCTSRNIGIEIDNDGITLTCRDCGNKKLIKTDSQAIKDLLNTSTIVLD